MFNLEIQVLFKNFGLQNKLTKQSCLATVLYVILTISQKKWLYLVIICNLPVTLTGREYKKVKFMLRISEKIHFWDPKQDPDPFKIIPDPGQHCPDPDDTYPWAWRRDGNTKVIFMLRISEKNSFRIRNRIRIRMNLPMSQETRREYKGNIHVKNIRKISCRTRNRVRIRQKSFRIQDNTVRIRIRTNHSGSRATLAGSGSVKNHSGSRTTLAGSGTVKNHSRSRTTLAGSGSAKNHSGSGWTYPWAWRRAPAASPSPQTSLWGPPASWTASPQIPA